ncbi:MAG: hypothetical protein NW701_19785 [Nitrospira sp.]
MIIHRFDCGVFLSITAIAFLSYTLTGCVWRGRTTDHYIGPLLFGTEEPRAKVERIDEQVHFPALIESGRQWGISLGIVRRITAIPQRVGAGRSMKRLGTSTPFFIIPITKHLALSPIYLRINRQTGPELRIRSLVGFQGAMGDEGNFLSIGLSTTWEFMPLQDGTYILCHDSHRPLETTFTVYKDRTLLAAETRCTE